MLLLYEFKKKKFILPDKKQLSARILRERCSEARKTTMPELEVKRQEKE
jgi:hypothetical protein